MAMNMEAPTSKGKVTILAVAVALVVVGGLVAYTYAGTRTTGTTRLSHGSSATMTGNGLTFFNSTISPDGLQLGVALNTTSLLAGKGLSAEAYLTNTLPRNVSLSANLTAFPGDPALEALGRGYACDGAGLLGILNFGLYQGHYTGANFSQEALPLILENPVAWNLGCPNPYYYVQSPPQSIEFAPNSDRATLSGQETMSMHISFKTVNCTAVPYKSGPSTIIENGSTTTSSGGTELDLAGGPVYEGFRGYWTMPSNGSHVFIGRYTNDTILQALKEAHGLYHEFTPGHYTIVAEDYWNQTVFAYFEVRANPSSSAAGGASTVVATVTVTETLTTQASQATTTYAIPTSSCTISPLVLTTTTTITVGPKPPASTTTTTVTTTSTSYTQTVTVTSCTGGRMSTVTSTVTTTATP